MTTGIDLPCPDCGKPSSQHWREDGKGNVYQYCEVRDKDVQIYIANDEAHRAATEKIKEITIAGDSVILSYYPDRVTVSVCTYAVIPVAFGTGSTDAEAVEAAYLKWLEWRK